MSMFSILFGDNYAGPTQAHQWGYRGIQAISMADYRRQCVHHFERTRREHESRMLWQQRFIDDVAGQIKGR